MGRKEGWSEGRCCRDDEATGEARSAGMAVNAVRSVLSIVLAGSLACDKGG